MERPASNFTPLPMMRIRKKSEIRYERTWKSTAHWTPRGWYGLWRSYMNFASEIEMGKYLLIERGSPELFRKSREADLLVGAAGFEPATI